MICLESSDLSPPDISGSLIYLLSDTLFTLILLSRILLSGILLFSILLSGILLSGNLLYGTQLFGFCLLFILSSLTFPFSGWSCGGTPFWNYETLIFISLYFLIRSERFLFKKHLRHLALPWNYFSWQTASVFSDIQPEMYQCKYKSLKDFIFVDDRLSVRKTISQENVK